jgi:hypothetical protein
MTTDPTTTNAPSAGQASTHLSESQAEHLSRDGHDQQLQVFIDALAMKNPVDPDKAARLLEHVIKEAMSANIDWLQGQMLEDGWEASLAPGENLIDIATRANNYLESEQGLELFNLFTKSFARTTGEIFD